MRLIATIFSGDIGIRGSTVASPWQGRSGATTTASARPQVGVQSLIGGAHRTADVESSCTAVTIYGEGFTEELDMLSFDMVLPTFTSHF
jgi:hypothetical protein